MALINSMGVGRAKKSMGNVTYRTVRGRTIGSQKKSKGVTGATTRGQSGNVRKPLFAMINMFMQAHASDIEVSFNKSKYGSQRNYFFANNYKGLSAALLALANAASLSGALPNIAEIEAAITAYATANPSAIYRIKLMGFETMYMSGSWSSDDNPISGGASDGLGTGTAKTTASEAGTQFVYNAPTTFSTSFHAGAKIVRGAGTVSITGAAIPSGLTTSNISYLTTNGAPVSPAITVTGVTSVAGQVSFSSPEILATSNVLAVLLGQVYVRLSSAYVKTEAEVPPLG